MKRRSRIILGLNSGTSADGVDAVACEITGRGLGMKVRVLGDISRPYSDELRRRILAVMAPALTRTEELCRLETLIGEAFAEAAARLVKKLGLVRVDLVGSHGQTICHLPPAGGGMRFRRDSRAREHSGTSRGGGGRSGSRTSGSRAAGTMQIGNPSIIACRLGVPVVSHFRQADMAVGGQGAPLVPWTDHVLFRHPTRSRIIQNIGGIANLTWLPAGGDESAVMAFDTGPGNMLIDEAVRRFSKGVRHCDVGGKMAAAGRPVFDIVSALLSHPFIVRRPPKSCGREQFGEAFLQRLLGEYANLNLPENDWIATLTSFTARSIALGTLLIDDLFPPSSGLLDDVILCGGGAHNATLVAALSRAVRDDFHRANFKTTADYGIPVQAKECVSFAMLAAACVDRIPANLPQVTGARRRVVLGQVCDPEPRR